MPKKDGVRFVVESGCKDAAAEISKKIVEFAGSNPTEDEVLSRWRHVSEFILHYALSLTGETDLERFEVEVQHEEQEQ